MAEENKKTQEKKDEKGIPAWALPILSALGSMGGSYMFWVKPLQDSFKAMSNQIEKLKDEIEELRDQMEQEKELRQEMNGLEEEENDNYFLQSGKNKKNQKPLRKKSIVSIH